jgi:hypothetical protein
VTDPVAERTVDLKASVSHRGTEAGVVDGGAGADTGMDRDEDEGWVVVGQLRQ